MVASWRKEETSTFVVRTPDADAWRLSLAQYPIIAASVRVLGAWLAEDTLTLADEVYKLFPFLLELASTSYPEEEDEDLLKFLLPGLCHMTADDKARPVLMVTGLGMILERYMNKLWPLAKQSRSDINSLINHGTNACSCIVVMQWFEGSILSLLRSIAEYLRQFTGRRKEI